MEPLISVKIVILALQKALIIVFMKMTDYCLFTVEHSKARRIYIRGIADITQPIDDYDKIILFYHGSKLKPEIPPNPFEEEAVEQKLYDEMTNELNDSFEEFGDELVFSHEEEETCRYLGTNYHITKEKVII